MNRTLLTIAAVLSASSAPLADAAVKGTALLLLAAIAAMILRRDSAATRHLVWLLAMVALLVVPVLSALLPEWRVLPAWASVPPATSVTPSSPPSLARPAVDAVQVARDAGPDEVEPPSAPAQQSAAVLPDARPALVPPQAIPASADWSWNWLSALPLAWAIGFCVLILRLMAARWLLWNTERQGAVIWSLRQPTKASTDPIATALEAVCLQLGICRPVTLQLHPDKTIPVVWGILRCRLLLPAAARQWSGEQLRSVLLHELAHVKRRDTMAQLLTQIACALYWFNPLVWLAAWRLGVERERACDDLVLAGGVRPSAYAGHLLEAVTGLGPARRAQSCGLAMARKSSLEGRLVAVLSDSLNRRGVPTALAAISLVITVGIAVPIAMLRAAHEKPFEKPKPVTTDMQPKHEYAQALFKKWQANARTDEKIPGALIGHVAREIDNFFKQYPQDKKAPELAALRPRLDASHDWTQADVVALFDDITAISTAPVSWADMSMEFDAMRKLRPGQSLPDELASAAWGAPAANGLRAAWLLEPRAEQYAHGSAMKARVLFHNTGKEAVVFKTETWHQGNAHTAHDAQGVKISVSAIWYSGFTPLATYRLAPGEYCEVRGHGIAIGSGKNEEEFSIGGVGAVIQAKEGDEVTLTHSVDTTYEGWTRPSDPKDPAELWKKSIAERVEREGPMPQASADRAQLIRRVTLDVFGVVAGAAEITAFIGDNAPDALAKLTARLQAKPRIEPWTGKLPTGETKFRVTAADPNAAKGPRTANAPGRYVLGDSARLLVSQLTEGGKRTNTARIAFLSPDPKVASPHKPHEIALPDGIGTYGIVWERGTGVLWVVQRGLVRKHDFTNPAQVKESRFEPGSIADVPEQLRGALRKVFEGPGIPEQESPKPKEGAKLDPATLEGFWEGQKDGVRVEVKFQWLSEHKQVRWEVKRDGSNIDEQMSVVMEPDGGAAKFVFRKGLEFEATKGRVQPGEGGTLRLEIIPNPAVHDLVLKRWIGRRARLLPKSEAARPLFKKWQEQARADGAIPGKLLEQLGVSVKQFLKNNPNQKWPHELHVKLAPPLITMMDLSPEDAIFLLDEVAEISTTPIQMILNGRVEGAVPMQQAPKQKEGAKLVPGETSGAAATGNPEPKNKEAKALFKMWQDHARGNGDFPGGLVGRLEGKVMEFIRNNTGDAAGDPYAKKMAPLVLRTDAARDWKPAEVAALLDDIAAITTIPLETTREEIVRRTIRKGTPLPAEPANAPWGEAPPNGLRLVWLLEPRAAEHRLGTPLKSRILIHNAGKDTVVFRTRTWHQSAAHKARDAKGAAIKIESTHWTTIAPLVPFRLAPGEFVEFTAAGVGVGKNTNDEDWQNTRVGSWVDAKEGDDVTFTPAAVPLSDWNEEPAQGGEPRWWLDFITARLSRHLPLPADKAEREHLLHRVALDLFGTPVSEEIITAFVADRKPDALDSLAKRLFHRPGLHAWAGPLSSGPTKFRVLPADPDAAKKPRTANNPGRYTLGANIRLVVSRRPDGERIVNEARIQFFSSDPTKPAPRKPHEIKLEDGYNTWAAAWMPGTTVLWVLQKGNVRSYDFTNPAQVKETHLEGPAILEKVPQPILGALRAALGVPGAPTPRPAAPE